MFLVGKSIIQTLWGLTVLPPPCSCVFEYNDPDDYFDVSNHEVDRQEDLEYEVRTLILCYDQTMKNVLNVLCTYSVFPQG